MDQKPIHEPPVTDDNTDTHDDTSSVPPLSELEILAVRKWLAQMEKIAGSCPIAGRALSRR